MAQFDHAVLQGVTRHAVIHAEVQAVLFHQLYIPQGAKTFQVGFAIRLWQFRA
jgi:hypothetical protein